MNYGLLNSPTDGHSYRSKSENGNVPVNAFEGNYRTYSPSRLSPVLESQDCGCGRNQAAIGGGSYMETSYSGGQKLRM